MAIDLPTNSPSPVDHFSSRLSPGEINNPYLAIADFFEEAEFGDWKEMLWNSFKSNITGNYPKGLSRAERLDIVCMHESLDKLVEAVHIINEREVKGVVPKKTEPVFYPINPDNIKDVLETICKRENIELAKMYVIVSNIPQVTNADQVFFLNYATDAENKPQFDFLALLPGSSGVNFNEYQKLFENACAELASVKLWLAHTSEVYKLLNTGHVFYSLACVTERLVYDARKIKSPDIKTINTDDAKGKARNTFNRVFAIAHSFLDGARYYITTAHLKIATFMLHQATEHSLRALLYSLTGYNKYGHNLGNLLRLCNFCAPELHKVFPQDSEKEIRLFQLLNNAYINTRYRGSYEISEDEFVLLLEKTDRLQSDVQQFFEEKLIVFEKMFEVTV